MASKKNVMDFDFFKVAKTADVKSIWSEGFNFRRADTKAFNAAGKKIAFVTEQMDRYCQKSVATAKEHSPAAVIVKNGFSYEPITLLDIEKGVLSRFDIVWFPGGFGYFPNKTTANNLRKFVSSGGGLIGICAGAFVPLRPRCSYKGIKGGLSLLPVTFDHFRESGYARVNFNPKDPLARGLKTVAKKPVYALYQLPREALKYTVRVTMLRGNGPLMRALSRKAGVAAYYDGSNPYAAVVRGKYGQGRIVVFSAHPDAYMGDIARFASPADAVENMKMIKNAILYCGG